MFSNDPDSLMLKSAYLGREWEGRALGNVFCVLAYLEWKDINKSFYFSEQLTLQACLEVDVDPLG